MTTKSKEQLLDPYTVGRCAEWMHNIYAHKDSVRLAAVEMQHAMAEKIMKQPIRHTPYVPHEETREELMVRLGITEGQVAEYLSHFPGSVSSVLRTSEARPSCDFCGATGVPLKSGDAFTYCGGGRAACRGPRRRRTGANATRGWTAVAARNWKRRARITLTCSTLRCAERASTKENHHGESGSEATSSGDKATGRAGGAAPDPLLEDVGRPAGSRNGDDGASGESATAQRDSGASVAGVGTDPKAGLASKLQELCDGAIENHCTMLEEGNGCEDYGRDVEQWCGVCLFVHDVRVALSVSTTEEKS